jgi:hypothetical protein
VANNALVLVENRLKTLDVTKLVEYSRKIKDIGSLNNMMAPQYLRDFIIAQDYTSSMLAGAVRCDLEAQGALDTAKSIAYLDRAGEYLEKKGIKDTSEARKQYVDLDEDVRHAADLKAKTAALVVFLKNKYQTFRQAHDDIKKMVYGDPYQTPNEGF